MARNEYLTDCCNDGQNIDNSNYFFFSTVSFPRFEDRLQICLSNFNEVFKLIYFLIVVPESITTQNNLLQSCNIFMLKIS